MKKWGEMTDDEREDFMNNLDREDENNRRKWSQHLLFVGDSRRLAEMQENNEEYPSYRGDRILENFYRGKEEYGC